MEIKIKKIKNDDSAVKETGVKKPRKRIKKIAEDEKITLTNNEQAEVVDTYVTETLAAIEDSVIVSEESNATEMPITSAINIDFLEWKYNLKEKSF
ncbi:MAG: hypothetical protein WC422_04890 [Candidatus Paceibacterota bacterium]|jgi:hypothetical protein